jgi:hypothetical protein
MKLALLTAILMILPAAHAGLSTGDDDTNTDARANVVDACFGACEKDQNQVNFTTSPYEVEKKYKEIMQDHGVIKPPDLEHGEGKKEKSWDI